MSQWEQNNEIKIFREYLRIPSVHPNIDYEPCIAFLKRQAQSLELEFKVYAPVAPNWPLAILTWPGTDPNAQSIILNSHMDVVPVFAEHWTHPPFAAEMDADGKIFARGSQDMKCVGMQYLAAIRSLKANNIRLKRTVHVSFVPEEELGGKPGMCKFVHTPEFRALNVGFALDEGIAGETDVYPIFYAERAIWHTIFKCSGTPGHGSLLLKNTAGEKIRYIIDRMMDLREHEKKKLENNSELKIGDVTTINLNLLKGGVQSNVVPPLLTAVFDIRLALDVNHDDFEKQLNKWCEEAGGGIEIEYEQKEPRIIPTELNDSNLYWMAFEKTVDSLGLKLSKQVFPGGTDSRYIREVGIPAIGFSPMNNTPVLLHDHDEFLKASTYLRGIEIYEKLIPAVANV